MKRQMKKFMGPLAVIALLFGSIGLSGCWEQCFQLPEHDPQFEICIGITPIGQ